ncbi:MAG: NADH-quinone oxidoreductase subunit N [Myxococcota bacterium]|nr:NADH-quinone oxidoreductase subunit N [Myxococcota bacterium]MDW8362558.1 NADH-quinone oxidoreductase subunit N [Myxococcales bacterium]
MSGWIALAPLGLLVAGAVGLMLADAFARERAELATLSTVVLLTAAGISLGLWVGGGPAEVPAEIARWLATDRMSLFFDVVICGGAALSALLAGGYLREHGLERGEFYVVLVLATAGAVVLARAVDLVSLFIGLETVSLGAYALAGFRRTSARAVEGALKYFLLGSFAAAVLLFGAALLYGATGRTDLVGIGQAVRGGQADLPLLLLSLFLVLVGLAFKVSAVPFHVWTPDAYEGAVTPATAFMAVAVKSAAFAALVRVLLTSFGDELSASVAAGWPPVLAALAVASLVWGNLAALVQGSVKRMLAYSSIAHAGYVLIGAAAVPVAGKEAVSAVFYYLMAYTVSNALAFGALILAGSKGREAVSYEDLAGLGRRHPMVAVPFVVAIASLIGVPPTAGFFAKYYVLAAAVQAGGGYVWLAVIGVVASVVGAYYYLRVLVYLFMREPRAGAPIAVPMKSGYVVLALVLAGYFVVRMGVAPDAYLEMALEAASRLVA